MADQQQTGNSPTANAQHQAIKTAQCDNPETFRRNDHPDAQWFPQAGLGLFLHWGIASVSGKTDLSWGMMYDTPWDADQNNENKLTPNEYYRLAERFNPSRYDPDKWLKAAAAAGFQYAVLTTKHHDGYAMWPSAVGDLGVRKSLNGRDLVRPFVEACRKNGLKVGLYYSPPDWYYNKKYMSFHYGSGRPAEYPGRLPFDMDHRPIATLPEKPEGFDEGYKAYIRAQAEELLTRYGKIDLLFFDGGPEAISFGRIRELQPGIVVNPRMHGYGDYATPECEMPARPPDGWWELCDIWNNGNWGYEKDAETYKDMGWMLSLLCRARAWGGNFLANAAPRPDGEMPEAFYRKLDELRKWMNRCGEAITGAQAGNYPDGCNVPCTVKGGAVYCFLLPGAAGHIEFSCGSAPRSVRLLWTGDAPEVRLHTGGLRIDVPEDIRTRLVDVVRIEF